METLPRPALQIFYASFTKDEAGQMADLHPPPYDQDVSDQLMARQSGLTIERIRKMRAAIAAGDYEALEELDVCEGIEFDGEDEQAQTVEDIDVNKVEPPGEDSALAHQKESPASIISHIFPLRPDLAVKIPVPLDLTAKEVERLSSWLRSLPFE